MGPGMWGSGGVVDGLDKEGVHQLQVSEECEPLLRVEVEGGADGEWCEDKTDSHPLRLVI